ncbi:MULTISPECIES: DUF6807 family protein [unclassified Arthrobacter]|uniref:DUF6807 family protein n=1 Tax=unclassified Arthrobacter TaxID=235627 RepID=UPI001492371A|nr:MULTISPECIES: DUF6807 family protein [unclassified Arthrobacter]MBE0010612.1 oxidoreductase [Arthrobacter sp. AET 35A]NOJ64373.1 Gfo/Idh/MocA family oxidoreductase [Arthrobacter sp. 147(2020)]
MPLPDSRVAATRQTGHLAPASTVALVGVHGYGARHLVNLARLEDAGQTRLVAVADPTPPEPGAVGAAVEVHSDLASLAGSGATPDVVVIATPIQSHAPLARTAFTLGSDVYLEKPPVASMAQFEELLAEAATAGVAVQTGFQSLGSLALDRIDELLATGQIGAVRGISAEGRWVRTRGYFKRSRWAGKRTLDGVDVVDGVATNPLAHAVATALRVAGARTREDILSVETDLFRAHDIESDDTSSLRIRTSAGLTVMCALTLCAATQERPSVTVEGTTGRIVFYYTEDELAITTTDGDERVEHFGRTDLLENLLRHRATGETLLSPLEASGAFMTVMEAIRTADAPRAIPDGYVTWEGDGDDAHPVVRDVETLIQRAQKAQALFSEILPDWAGSAPSGSLLVNGTNVADYRDGASIAPTLAPRPYLHPVRTLNGTVVTDHLPLDHVWHLGVGVAIQDVNGVNCWGGRTYRREAGRYIWREDHGRIHASSQEFTGASLQENLVWSGPDGTALLDETRRWEGAPVNDTTWLLSLSFTLAARDARVDLGSPGSNGRAGGGYGGFFWRLPAAAEPEIRTEDAAGEAGVHGSTSPWLSFSAQFSGSEATLVFLAAPEAPDPWFVRSEGYPGVGLSLAWETPLTVAPGTPVTRTVRVLVADGRLDVAQITSLTGAIVDLP